MMKTISDAYDRRIFL